MFKNLTATARADAFALMALHGYTQADVEWLIESADAMGVTPAVALADALAAWESTPLDALTF